MPPTISPNAVGWQPVAERANQEALKAVEASPPTTYIHTFTPSKIE